MTLFFSIVSITVKIHYPVTIYSVGIRSLDICKNQVNYDYKLWAEDSHTHSIHQNIDFHGQLSTLGTES